jgi:hypothetical protein
LRVVLGFAEAARVTAVEDLHLAAAGAVRAHEVEIGIAGELIEGGVGLFAVADGAAARR